MFKKWKWIMLALIMILFSAFSAQAENTLVLPAGTMEIQAQAFYGDTAIGEVKLPEGLLRIESQAFAESSVTKINLPSSLAFIAEDAFKNCNGLDHVAVQAGTYAYTRAHEIGLFDLRAVISGNIEAAIAGENIVWTAKAMNGVAPYKYLFEVYRNGEKIDSRAYTAEDSYTYQFTRAGEYYAIVKIKDDDGNVASAKSAIVTVTANAPVIESVNSNLSEIKTTEEVRWTVSVKKGTPPYTYAFALNQGDQVVAESENSIGEYSFTFEEAGDYILSVTVTDAYQESASTEIAFSVSLRPVEIESVTCSHEALEVDTEISWTVNAAAGVKPYSYSFILMNGDETIVVSEAQTDNFFSYTFETSGEYTLSIIVTDAQGTQSAAYTQALSVAPRPLVIEGIEYKELAELGNTVTWTVKAAGGMKPLRYAFDLYMDGEEIDGTAFGESNSFTFTPDQAGKYSVRVRVRDDQNTTVEMLSGEVTVYTVTAEEFFTYSFYDEKATITGYTGTAANVYIPATIGGYPVTDIGYGAFTNCSSLTSVVIPNTVTFINTSAFRGCSNLLRVIIPDSVTTIGGSAFSGCSKLTSVVLPKGLKSISSNLFYNCKSLENVTIPESVTSIDYYAFYGCSSLESVTIPDGVMSIGYDAFRNCSSLANIIFSEGLKSIGSSAFYGCSSLESVMIPAGVTNIAYQAFMNCTGLKSAVIPEGVTKMETSVFNGCSSLESITLPKGVTSIGSGAFSSCTSLTGVKLPEGITTIGSGAFEYCTNMIQVTIPESVTNIGSSAFDGCIKLESVTIPEGVTVIGSYTFRSCRSLTNVTLPKGVTTIGGDAFSQCKGLKSIVIPEGVTSIGSYAFVGCSSLESVIIPEGVTRIENYTFNGCSNLTSVTIPESMTSIGQDAFSLCSSLISAILPEGVTHIGSNAFKECSSLESMTIPESMTSIGSQAFSGCDNLISVTIPKSVTNMGYSAFYGCSNLTSVTISEGVTGIGKSAFAWCGNLVSVTIPESVTSIGEGTFTGCNKNLIVFCHENSTAHTYCVNNNVKYQLIAN